MAFIEVSVRLYKIILSFCMDWDNKVSGCNGNLQRLEDTSTRWGNSPWDNKVSGCNGNLQRLEDASTRC